MRTSTYLRSALVLLLAAAATVDLNLFRSRKDSPLQFATRKKQRECVAVLEAAGATWSSSPLHDAAAKGQVSVIESLVSQGADVDARAGSHASEDCISESLNPNAREQLLGWVISARRTAVHWAVEHNQPASIEALVKMKADVSISDKCACFAACCGCKSVRAAL